MRSIHLAAFATPLVLAACHSFRPVSSLTESERADAAALRPRLAHLRVEIVAGSAAAPASAERLAAALGDLGIATGVESDRAPVRVEVDGPKRPNHFAHGERDALLFVLTLGLWPQSTAGGETWRFRIVDGDGVEESVVDESKRPELCGWLAGPLALLPNWTFGGAGCHGPPESDEERAARLQRAALALARRLADRSD